MELAGPAFNKAKSNLRRRKICVHIGSYKFPKTCLLCGGIIDVTLIPVEFKAVLILGIVGGGETTTLPFPLCETCATNYKNRVAKANVWMTACFIIGFGSITIPQFMSEIAPRTLKKVPDAVGIAIAGLAIFLIVASFVMLLMKNRNFPIKLKHRGWILKDDKHLVFTFPNEEVMHRFIAANSGSEEGIVAPSSISTQSFDKGL